MSDLDDEELEATRRLNGVAKMSDIEKDIKFIEEMIKEYNTFGDLHNPDYENTDKIYKALENMLERIKELEAKQEIKQIVDKIPVEEIEERIKIDIISEEAFNELIDNFEVVETLTEYGRKAIKQNVKKLQKRIKELEEENKKYIVQLTDEQYRNLVDVIRKEVKKEFEQKVIDRINYCDERIKHAKQIRDKEQEEFYIDLKRAFNKLLEENKKHVR